MCRQPPPDIRKPNPSTLAAAPLRAKLLLVVAPVMLMDAGPPEVGVPSPVAAADVTTVPAPAANGLHAPFACPSCREAFMKESACFKHVRSDFDCKGAYGTLEQSELRRLCSSGR
mmetsp:Transcript_19222/g.66761  ORF Transcript_19222/g.66761 Transcript_19222/m.66761 type:complete len:115 (-) Transcript_19222:228-572(-)